MKRRYFPFLVVILLWLAALGKAQAQENCISFTPNFSTYTSESTDGTNIYGSTTLDGSGTMEINYQYEWCESVVIPPNIVHSPEVNMQIGSTTSYNQGPGVCPDCYMSSDDDIEFDDADAGVIYDLDWWADALCSMAGNFYAANGYVGVAIAVTTYKISTVNPNGSGNYVQACPGTSKASCGAANYLGSEVHNWAEEFQLKVTIGGQSGYSCFPAAVVQYKDGPPAPYPCT